MKHQLDLFGTLSGPMHHLARGSLEIWLKRNANDWMIAWRRTTAREDGWARDESSPDSGTTPTLSWKRFAVQEGTRALPRPTTCATK